MAKIELLVPHILRWEAGIVGKGTNEQLFEKARKTGFSDDPDDVGGATMIGVTISTFETYCKRKGYPKPTVERLKNIPYSQWLDIMKSMYWDKWQADKINNQSIANVLVDWVWASGLYGIKIPQRLLKLQDDGIVGPKTLSAVNSFNQETLFNLIQVARRAYIEDIIRRRPSNAKFRTGWLNRINSFEYEG